LIGRKAFAEQAWPLIGRKVSKARVVNDIYETACASIALPIEEDSTAVAMFRMVIAQARTLIQQRNEIERIAHEALATNSDYQLLRMIPGIGPINAPTILAEAGDLRRFSHHRQFLKFCGLDLATYQSGIFRGRTKLSKYGNARLRCTFWMATQVAIRHLACASHFKDGEDHDLDDRWILCLLWPRVLSLTVEAIWITHSSAPTIPGATRPAGLSPPLLPDIGRCR
jgi:hypothetical protein